MLNRRGIAYVSTESGHLLKYYEKVREVKIILKIHMPPNIIQEHVRSQWKYLVPNKVIKTEFF
jgi:hypothetical protein